MIRRIIACLLSTAAPSAAWDFSFDFRATAAFVADPSSTVFASFGVTNYPTTVSIGGQTVTYGWESVGATLARDRSTSSDPRVGGMNCQLNDGNTSVFRVDLPSIGIYSIGLAAGDPGGYTDVNYVGISSANNNLISFRVTTGATSIADLADVTGASIPVASWPGSNQMIQKTFAASILRLTLGGTADNAYSCVSHLRVTLIRAGAPPSGGGSFFVL